MANESESKDQDPLKIDQQSENKDELQPKDTTYREEKSEFEEKDPSKLQSELIVTADDIAAFQTLLQEQKEKTLAEKGDESLEEQAQALAEVWFGTEHQSLVSNDLLKTLQERLKNDQSETMAQMELLQNQIKGVLRILAEKVLGSNSKGQELAEILGIDEANLNDILSEVNNTSIDLENLNSEQLIQILSEKMPFWKVLKLYLLQERLKQDLAEREELLSEIEDHEEPENQEETTVAEGGLETIAPTKEPTAQEKAKSVFEDLAAIGEGAVGESLASGLAALFDVQSYYSKSSYRNGVEKNQNKESEKSMLKDLKLIKEKAQTEFWKTLFEKLKIEGFNAENQDSNKQKLLDYFENVNTKDYTEKTRALATLRNQFFSAMQETARQHSFSLSTTSVESVVFTKHVIQMLME